MVFDLSGLHDMNSGAILVMLIVATVRSRGTPVFRYAAAALGVAAFTMLPLPLHGTPLYGTAAVLSVFALFYVSWGGDEFDDLEQYMVLASLLLLMFNVGIGLHLSGRI